MIEYDCAAQYLDMVKRIKDYSNEHLSESIIPFTGETPDNCSYCGPNSLWEDRLLPGNIFQTRCKGCKIVVTFK